MNKNYLTCDYCNDAAMVAWHTLDNTFNLSCGKEECEWQATKTNVSPMALPWSMEEYQDASGNYRCDHCNEPACYVIQGWYDGMTCDNPSCITWVEEEARSDDIVDLVAWRNR